MSIAIMHNTAIVHNFQNPYIDHEFMCLKLIISKNNMYEYEYKQLQLARTPI